jgi:hypothetical protein
VRAGTTRRTRAALLLLSVAATGLVACGGGSDSKSDGIAPLTGLPVGGSESDRDRPALFVKIENSPDARPQTGLETADVVYEVVAEGGITRFAAVFQSTDPGAFGPVRSVRGQDPDLAGPLKGLVVFAGGIPDYVEQMRAVGQDLSTSSALGESPPFRRDSGKRAPHNLFGDAAGFWAMAESPYDSAPKPLFSYGDLSAGGSPAGTVSIDFSPSAEVSWKWDGSAWRRSQGGRPFTVTGEGRIGPANVIVQFVDVRETGVTDPAGNPVPLTTLVSSGEAQIFRNGQVLRGTWSKDDRDSPTRFTVGGEQVRLAPGSTWVELVPNGRSVDVSG